jgi:hypothetical protein
VTHQPVLNGRRLVCRGIVDDNMDLQVGGHGLVDLDQELFELDSSMLRRELVEDLTGDQVHGRVQVDRAVALVVVALPLGHPRQQRQDRLGPVERLDLGFLVDTKDRGMIGRVHVQPDQVSNLVDEQRIGGQLEGVEQSGFRPNARQIRLTVECDIPAFAAIDRVDQCVASAGISSRVLTMTASTMSSVTLRGTPGRGSSTSPSRRLATNRARHLPTVASATPNLAATSRFELPSAQASTIRQRNANI